MNTPKPLLLTTEHKEKLEKIIRSGMTPAIIVQRAKILLFKANGRSNDSVAEGLGINKGIALLWTQKYCNRSADETPDDSLNVSEGRNPKEEISCEAKTWIIGIACQKPKGLEYTAETWTNSALTRHIRQHAVAADYQRLTTILESRVYNILSKSNIKPFRVQYYCERRDPDFDSKMHNVLLVYKQVLLQFDEKGNLFPFEGQATHVLSYDEKSGIQTITVTGENRLPNGEYGTIK